MTLFRVSTPPGKYIKRGHSLLIQNQKSFYLHRHNSATNIQNTDDSDCTFRQMSSIRGKKRSVNELRHVASDLAPILGPTFGPILGLHLGEKEVGWGCWDSIL